MDVRTRLANTEQQSHELHRQFSHLDHRIREFIELQSALGDLHQTLSTLTSELSVLRAELDVLHRVLPSVARKEELERLEKKIDAVPFELFATSKLPSPEDDDVL